VPVDTSGDSLNERGCRRYQPRTPRRSPPRARWRPATGSDSCWASKGLDRSLGLTVARRESRWNGGVDREFVTGEVP